MPIASLLQVTVAHNEIIVPLPPCPTTDSCPLHRVKQYYRDTVYPLLGMGKCTVGDWMAKCGRVKNCSEIADGSSDD